MTSSRRRRPKRPAPARAAGPLSGVELELTVERVAHGGVFVAHHEGRVVFVADSLPGERIRARIVDEGHAAFLRAETLEVLEPAAGRRAHIWSAASIERAPEDRAGGAEFGHIEAAVQRELKQQVLIEALLRVGRRSQDEMDALDTTVRTLPGAENGTRTRTRVRLHTDQSGRIGPYAARSHRVIPVEDLPLGVAALERIADLQRARTRAAGAGRQRASDGIIDLVAPSRGPAFRYEQPGGGGPTVITEVVEDREFVLDGRGFWQVHPAAPATLSAAAQRAIDPDLLDPAADNLDLYGGVGLLAAAVGDLAGPGLKITTVESDARASTHAAHNLRDLPRARAAATSVDDFLAEDIDADAASRALVVLDPPRSGAGHRTIDAIAQRDPRQIVYVACDPVALARDVDRLAGHGYRIQHLEAFDLFPNTHHLECVVALRR